MCERHTTKVYLNKEQAQEDETKVKIREMKALHLFHPFSVVYGFLAQKRQKEMSGICGVSKSKIAFINLQFI